MNLSSWVEERTASRWFSPSNYNVGLGLDSGSHVWRCLSPLTYLTSLTFSSCKFSMSLYFSQWEPCVSFLSVWPTAKLFCTPMNLSRAIITHSEKVFSQWTEVEEGDRLICSDCLLNANLMKQVPQGYPFRKNTRKERWLYMDNFTSNEFVRMCFLNKHGCQIKLLVAVSLP